MRVCSDCGIVRPLDFFNKNETRCKPCKLERTKEWQRNNPERVKLNDRVQNLRKYGISLDEYNRMFEKQAGCCAVCQKHQTELSRILMVDHDHTQGFVCVVL